MNAIPQLELTASCRFELSTWLRTPTRGHVAPAIDGVPGQVEMAVMSIVPDVVVTQEAWPHPDPKWPTSVSYTRTVDGDMYEVGLLSHPPPVGWRCSGSCPVKMAGAFELALAGATEVKLPQMG